MRSDSTPDLHMATGSMPAARLVSKIHATGLVWRMTGAISGHSNSHIGLPQLLTRDPPHANVAHLACRAVNNRNSIASPPAEAFFGPAAAQVEAMQQYIVKRLLLA